jgi:uncharacterized protein
MNFLDFYYYIKPLIPRRIQIAARRQVVQRQRIKYQDVWPIDPEAGKTPPGWPGWPEGKQFALVLTHDVETAEGLANVRPLAELEMRLGFRSSFNFVPGDYPVQRELREYLIGNGFEVGVHGYTHKKGNLFKSDQFFNEQAQRINSFIQEWGAVGFRTPSLYHDLEKIQQLEIEYDSSTFDSDPFEPQPDGAGTIFPFWVSNKNGGGFVELPYTLPQDHTLYIVMQEKDAGIWKRKLDWIASRRGMVLLVVHPDYLVLDSQLPAFYEYPVRFYENYLNYVKTQYEGKYWHLLPRDLAHYYKQSLLSQPNQFNEPNKPNKPSEPIELSAYKRSQPATRNLQPETSISQPFTQSGKSNEPNKPEKPERIWIDLDNSPHVPFFFPIINELKKRNCEVILTARDCAQTCGLADLFKMSYKRIGRHYGKSTVFKVAGTVLRALQLLQKMKSEKPDLTVSHGSRAQMLAAMLLRVPSVAIMDYEHVKGFIRPTWVMLPEVISENAVKHERAHILRYPGIKEDVYVPDFHPDLKIRNALNIGPEEILITIRPPATQAHYHNPEAEVLLSTIINYLGNLENARMVILPRNEEQAELLKNTWPEWHALKKIIIPEQVIDGLNLLWNSDLAISGGGTMNREAAALGVPVYSIFRGKTGDVDKYLVKMNRLVMLESPKDFTEKLIIVKRSIPEEMGRLNHVTLNTVVENILKALQEKKGTRIKERGSR